MERITFEALFRGFLRFYASPNCEDPKKSGTLGNYEKRYRKITAWLHAQQLADLPAEDFTISIAKRLFRDLLQVHGRNYSVRVVKMAGQVLQWGIDEELIGHHPLKFLRLRGEGRKKIVYLTPDEVTEIAGWVFRSRMLNQVKWTFIVACYTGLDYGDSMAFIAAPEKHITRHTDGREYIIKPRAKALRDNINEAIIPLHPMVKAILKQSRDLLGKISNASYNRVLKEMIWVVGFEKKVSTHTARKTFAMIMLNWELYSIDAVSKMLGHVRVKTTEDSYAQVNIERISRELDKRKARRRAA